MANVNVIPLNSPRKQRKPAKAKQPVSAHRVRQERIAAGIRTFLTAVNVGVIAVSLNDIAACAMHYGHVGQWQGYALAAGVDCAYIGMEFAGLFASTPHQRERIHQWTRVAVPVIATVSAMANMCEFTAAATTAAETAIGCVMGAFVPAVAYVTNRVLAVMYDR
jgi:Cys-tRNA synthase (O-phospho-L-seryl-tRNA:Cys-tRNA synthase)